MTKTPTTHPVDQMMEESYIARAERFAELAGSILGCWVLLVVNEQGTGLSSSMEITVLSYLGFAVGNASMVTK